MSELADLPGPSLPEIVGCVTVELPGAEGEAKRIRFVLVTAEAMSELKKHAVVEHNVQGRMPPADGEDLIFRF